MRAVNVMSGLINACIAGAIIVACAQSGKEDTDQIKCLADNIYFEAGIESDAGKIAVGNVTMNRVKSKHFPNTVCEVVWEDKQFSWTHDGKSDNPGDKVLYADIYEIARSVYNGNMLDITEGSTFYHADYISAPSWTKAMKKVGQIDQHIFYYYEGR